MISRACVLVLALTVIAPAQWATNTVIHNFSVAPHGGWSFSALIRDASGNLYGTAYAGGRWDNGAVYKLDTQGRQTVLYSFTGGPDGGLPNAPLFRDAAGNLYGTTGSGGIPSKYYPSGWGVVFKVDPHGRETVLHRFRRSVYNPNIAAGVIGDAAGNLYGVQSRGGRHGDGIVYKLTPSGQMSIVHHFTGGADGANPQGTLIADSSGNFYGTTALGGQFNMGVIYKLNAAGKETVLYNFTGLVSDGGPPNWGLTRDAAGNLYGTNLGVFQYDTSGKFTLLANLNTLTEGTGQGVVVDAAGNVYGAVNPDNLNKTGPLPYGGLYKVDAAGNFTVLYKFSRVSSPGQNSPVILDSGGNLYGATTNYGTTTGCSQVGILYKLDATGRLTTLYTFPEALHGEAPSFAQLVRDPAGNLYGTTAYGGPANCGVVYKLDPAHRETVLYSFQGGTDGYGPAGVTRDQEGNLYGTVATGSSGLTALASGIVYKIDTSGHKTVVHTFTGDANGGYPLAVTPDADGNLYGVTSTGGMGSCPYSSNGCGVVFQLSAAGEETVLYTFTGGADGGFPASPVIRDESGNLYGTTLSGGAGFGVVFKVDPAGAETVLHTFTGNADGGYPLGPLIFDEQGNIYGTNTEAQDSNTGVVFRIDNAGNFTVLYSFVGDVGGATGVVRDATGNLYGITSFGGPGGGCQDSYGCGGVYKLDLSGNYTLLHQFTGKADGGSPISLIIDPAGRLFGTAGWGAREGGVVFRIDLP